MKKFVMKFLSFSIFSVVFYLVFVVIFGFCVPKGLRKNLPHNLGGYGFLYSRLKGAKEVRKVDVLVLGSSHAYRGYDPRIFNKAGINMYNLGSSAQSLVQTEWILKKYIDQMHPRFIIIDIYPMVLNSDGVESTIDFLSNSELDEGLIKISLQTGNIKVYNTVIYAAFRNFFELNKGFVEKRKSKSDTYVSGGFVENTKKVIVDKDYKPYTYHINANQWAALNRIVDLIKSKNINFVMIQSPILNKRYRAITNNEEIDKILSQYSDYYNFNEMYQWRDEMFFDDAHLNQSGVNIFDSLLIHTIKLNNQLVSK